MWHSKNTSRPKIVYSDLILCTCADTSSVPIQNHVVIDSSGKKQCSLSIIEENRRFVRDIQFCRRAISYKTYVTLKKLQHQNEVILPYTNQH